MQGRAQQLNASRREKLRDACSADLLLYLLGEGKEWCNERREVEGCEDGEAVSEREQSIAGCWDCSFDGAADGGRWTKHFCELAVLIKAERHVDACCGQEFRRAG